MDITHITSLLGGIALFLYGMSIMGGGHSSELSANIENISKTLRDVAQKDMLSNSEKTYKPVSGLTDAEISSVRKKFAPAPKVENKPAAQPAKQSQPVKNDNRDNRQQNQAPKQPQQGTQNKSGNADDKKHISQVYFPQNSSRDKNSRS